MKPEIRFKGFADDWEEKTLGDVADITTGKLDANAMKEDGEYDFYTSGIKKYKIDFTAFEGPAITVAGNGATVGFMHLADGKFNAYQRTYILNGFKASRAFLFSEIGNILPIKISQEARTGNIPYIVLDMLTELNIHLPSPKEQSQIGSFFQNLDSLITLHQRKHDKLITVKKAMLEKMFPKDGEDVPAIRFKGFGGKWEEKTLGEITLKIGSGKTPKGGDSTYLLEGVALLRSQNIRDNVMDLSDVAYIHQQTHEEMINSEVVNRDVLLNITGASIGRSAVYNLPISSNVNQHVCILRPIKNFNSEFIQLNLASCKGQKSINNNQAGGAREGLNFQQISKMCFSFPSFKEQSKIGEYFQSLDSLISLQQQELEKLKNIKKACLEKMFV